MNDFIPSVKSMTPTELIDALNEGIIKCIQTSGSILPSSLIQKNAQYQCQWTTYASVEGDHNSSLFSPVVDDMRQFLPTLLDISQYDNLIGSNGRPLLYNACIGLLSATRQSHSNTGKSNDKATPLSTFLSIAEFLDDELDLDMNERTQTKGACHRPALHLLARSCYPDAVQFLLDRGAEVNARDDEGWTALMACCLPDISPEEEGGPSTEERVNTIKVLMKENMRGEHVDVNAQNYCGYTALHYACEGLSSVLIQYLLDTEEADATLKTIWGETVVGIVRSQRDQDLDKAAICETILFSHLNRSDLSNQIHSYLKDEIKALDLMNLINDVLIPVSRGVKKISSNMEDSTRGLSQDRRIIIALIEHFHLDSSVLFETSNFQQYEQNTNIYEIIYHRVCELIPQALMQVYCNQNPSDEERGIIISTNYDLRKSCEQLENEARYISPSALMSQSFCLHRQRGYVARQVELLTDLFVGPLQRTFSFAVPSNDVLEQIIQLAPRIMEVGAGTGYWSHQLSKLGADIIAYDATPPGLNTNNSLNSGDNIYFGSQRYFPVQYGITSTIFDGTCPDVVTRALLIVWPNNPDAIDNPHVAVAEASLPEVWDYECLQKYYEMGGETVIYVGERKENIKLMSNASAPDWGFCASSKFQQFLQTNFCLKAVFKCPKWWMKEDDVTVWIRASS